MIISHKYKYVFIEVPHTGTTAISQELRSAYAGEKILDKHSNYTEFRRHASRDELNYFVFAGVRNPLDIVVTEFYKYQSNHKHAFTELVGRGKWVTPEHLERYQYVRETGNFAGFLRKFYRSVYNNWFLIGHRRFNYIIRFENMETGYAEVLNRLGIEQARPLPVVNKSSRPSTFAELYSSESVDLAVRIFGPFMQKWGYALPDSWGHPTVPMQSRIAFRMKDLLAALGARYFTLNSGSRGVQLAQRLIDSVT